MNVIAVDIGNSTIAVGIGKGTEIDVYRIPTWQVSSPADFISKFYGFMDTSRVASIRACAICSVVPDSTDYIAEAIKEITGTEPMILGHNIDTGIILDIENPESLGTDRIASAAGALSLADPPFVILDFGTATTVNFIDPGIDGQPVFKGGAIMPGLSLMGEALEDRAAQLPRVAHGEIIKVPGRNTSDSILAGITYATAGGVERIIDEVESANGLRYRLMATGGMMEYAAAFIRRPTKRQPALTLRGLITIYERNRGAS